MRELVQRTDKIVCIGNFAPINAIYNIDIQEFSLRKLLFSMQCKWKVMKEHSRKKEMTISQKIVASFVFDYPR